MWNGWHMGGMWIWWVLAIALIAVVVWALVRGTTTQSPPRQAPPRERGPEEILKERYARGEIDAEEYRRRLDDLRQ